MADFSLLTNFIVITYQYNWLIHSLIKQTSEWLLSVDLVLGNLGHRYDVIMISPVVHMGIRTRWQMATCYMTKFGNGITQNVLNQHEYPQSFSPEALKILLPSPLLKYWWDTEHRHKIKHSSRQGYRRITILRWMNRVKSSIEHSMFNGSQAAGKSNWVKMGCKEIFMQVHE